MNILLKTVLTALLIVGISEISKRYILASAVLASIPFVSVLSMIWMYIEKQDPTQIIIFCHGTFWMVLPSLALFVILPLFLKKEVPFYQALPIAIIVMVGCYFFMSFTLRKFDIIKF